MAEAGEGNRIRPARGFVTFLVLYAVLIGVLAIIDRAGAPRAVADVVLAALALLVFVGAGFVARTLLFSRFALADRNLAPAWNGIALAASTVSGVLLFALTGPGFALGAQLAALLLAPAAGLVLVALVIAPELQRTGTASAAGLLAARFQSPYLGWIAAVVLAFASIVFLTAEFGVIARLAPRYLKLGVDASLGLAALAVLVALVLGGLRGATVAAVAAFLVIAAGILIPALSVLMSPAPFGPGVPPFAEAWQAFSRNGSAGIGHFQLAAMMISIAAGVAAMPAVSLRAAAATAIKTARSAFAVGLVCLAMLLWALPVHAAFGRLFASAGTVGVAMTTRLMPILDALFGAGIVAAALASAAALAFGTGRLLVNDLYAGLFDRAASPGRRLVLMRIVLMAVVLSAAWLAQTGGDPFRMASAGLSLAASVLPALLLARLPAMSWPAALASMLAALAVTLLALAAGWHWTAFGVERLAMSAVSAGNPSLGVGWFGVTPHAAGFFGVLAGLLAGIAASAVAYTLRRRSSSGASDPA
jgi:Na+(H+)/acetate symporter ActP